MASQRIIPFMLRLRTSHASLSAAGHSHYRIHNAAFQLANRPFHLTNDCRASLQTFHSFSSDSSSSPLRRRRRRNTGASADDPADNASSLDSKPPSNIGHVGSSSNEEPFTPLSPSTGQPLSSTEYLSLTTLSPWVPCPDVVIKRVFEIASASDKDTHVDLGCGDGRLNFAAVGFPHHVKSSIGVDVDENVLSRARGRMKKRFVPQWNHHALDDDGDTAKKEVMGELERLEFVQGDLVEVIQRQKYLHQMKLQENHDNSTTVTEAVTTDATKDYTEIDKLNTLIASSTIITMYFVHSALNQLQPYLASLFGGRDDVRIITIGYEMKDWEPDWAERVLDLTVFRYDMKNISKYHAEWSLDTDDKKSLQQSNNTIDSTMNNSFDDEESNTRAEFLRQQKHEQDMELLNSNLRIHHDQELDDFASFRAKRKAVEDRNYQSPQEWEEDWDFNEEEDVEAMMRQEEKSKADAKITGRRSLMAGLESEKMDTGKANAETTKSKPVWKKPE
eukprot:scaffold387669_cov89-Cyclotella_meneghiniana.AAC.2